MGYVLEDLDILGVRDLADDAATISLDLEKEEEELNKVYDEQKKIADDMAKAADLAKIEQDALLAKLQNTRQLLMEKKRQEEEKRAQEEDGILDIEKQQQEVAQQDVSQTQQVQDSLLVTGELQSNYVLEKIDDGFSSPTRTARRSSPVRTDKVLETANMFETGIEDSEDEEESIEVDALPIKENPPDSLQSASTSNVETENEKLEWSAAKYEEDKLKRELVENKKLDNLDKKGAVKTAPKKKSKPGAKPVEDDGQVVRRGRSQTRKEDDKGLESPSRSMVN
ncbi:uncharacterized protein LOC113333604 [Papaver somniferum]|uniref:uncharacterized protein LOC113333604 n=1 Tax=Papaver somniferum TaxID=3469 RepID=UPI000E6FBDE9|nr:uncharacterized protein LOC113333604 [Papaver somniferum]